MFEASERSDAAARCEPSTLRGCEAGRGLAQPSVYRVRYDVDALIGAAAGRDLLAHDRDWPATSPSGLEAAIAPRSRARQEALRGRPESITERSCSLRT